MERLKGWRTSILAAFVAIAWFTRIYLLPDELAAELLTGANMSLVLGGLTALIAGGKLGDAQLKKAANGS